VHFVFLAIKTAGLLQLSGKYPLCYCLLNSDDSSPMSVCHFKKQTLIVLIPMIHGAQSELTFFPPLLALPCRKTLCTETSSWETWC